MPAVAKPIPKSRRGPAHNRKLNEKKVRELHEKGVCPKDIATHQRVDHSAVWQFLDRLDLEKKQVERFKVNRADVFANLQGKALSVQEKMLDHLLSDGVLASLDDKAKVSLVNSINNVMGTAFDKERLERGQSTSNVSLIGRMMGSALTESYKTTTSSVSALPEADEGSHT